jgi:hypothetical protein
MDAKVVMSSSRNLARHSLADLFDALEPHKAHWYSILPPRSEEPSIIDLFLPLCHI